MKKTYILLAAGLAGASLLASCHKKDKETGEAPREVTVAEAYTDSVVLRKTYPGYLGSNDNAAVVARVDGQLLSKDYDGGTWVNKGQVLFRIDPTLYANAVQEAEGNLASAISQRDYAASHYEAVKKALKAEAVSKMEVLSAESALEQAEASIKSCQAALSTARTNLGYCTVVAPISGFVSDNFVGPGNYVAGSGAPVKLCEIYANDAMTATFEIEDAQYEKMVGRDGGIGTKLYDSIPLHFRDNMLHNYTARLSYESPKVMKNTGTIELKGAVQNIDNELKDGMYVTIDLPYGVDPKAILVKDASIGTDQLGKYLYVVNDSNKVVYSHIEVGELFRDSLRIVKSGIEPGQKYVLEALLTVRAGETVKPVLQK